MSVDSQKIIKITLMIGALGYFILPADVIPDMLGPIGFMDDSAALTFAFKQAKELFSSTSLEAAMEKTKGLMGNNFDEEKIAKLITLATKS